MEKSKLKGGAMYIIIIIFVVVLCFLIYNYFDLNNKYISIENKLKNENTVQIYEEKEEVNKSTQNESNLPNNENTKKEIIEKYTQKVTDEVNEIIDKEKIKEVAKEELEKTEEFFKENVSSKLDEVVKDIQDKYGVDYDTASKYAKEVFNNVKDKINERMDVKGISEDIVTSIKKIINKFIK